MIKRVILLILDACGIGELPDASEYGDAGAATIQNVARAVGGLNMPNCEKLGLGNIVNIPGIAPTGNPLACFGKMAEKSAGKDSTTGHWEIAGIINEKPFPVYPNGFPPEIVRRFESLAGLKTLGNKPASGTEIIKELGEEHYKSGKIILYTSADSVFQLAAHEEIISVEKLYEICQIARDMLTGENSIGRVIARPFAGQPGSFERTPRRKDFSLQPNGSTILDILMENGIPTISIGKVVDLFSARGFSKAIKANGNMAVCDKVIDEMDALDYGLIFANLVDFDMLWGHRNDVNSFADGLERFDHRLPEIINKLNSDDLLIITADHGCDPTLSYSTDHTREYVPLLVYNNELKHRFNLGTRESFADIAATVAESYKLAYTFPGTSFYGSLEFE